MGAGLRRENLRKAGACGGHRCRNRRDVALSWFKKNKIWIWKAYCRDTNRIIDWECGHRDKKTLSRLIERLRNWNIWFYHTDHFAAYPEVIDESALVQGKSGTVGIERNNSCQRHWFARFRRKSIVVSKSLHMVDLTMALFARFHVNGDMDDIISFFR